MPLGHIGLNVPDLAEAKAHYDGLMPLLAYEPFISGPGEFSYKPAADKPGTYLFFYEAQAPGESSRHRPGLQHLAFVLRTRSAVDEVHRAVRELGCEVVHAPHEFPEYHEGYYACFWLDPWGVMLEAVCHRDQS